METKIKIGLWVVTGIALIWIVLNSEKHISTNEKEVTFSTGCADIADLWSNLPQEQKIEECNKMLNQHTADLKNMGFAPKDCGVTEAEAKHCTGGMLGTQLICAFTCEK